MKSRICSHNIWTSSRRLIAGPDDRCIIDLQTHLINGGTLAALHNGQIEHSWPQQPRHGTTLKFEQHDRNYICRQKTAAQSQLPRLSRQTQAHYRNRSQRRRNKTVLAKKLQIMIRLLTLLQPAVGRWLINIPLYKKANVIKLYLLCNNSWRICTHASKAMHVSLQDSCECCDLEM